MIGLRSDDNVQNKLTKQYSVKIECLPWYHIYRQYMTKLCGKENTMENYNSALIMGSFHNKSIKMTSIISDFDKTLNV